MQSPAKVGINSVGWVDIGQGPEIRIYIRAINRWITVEEHQARKNERRITWLATKPSLLRRSSCHLMYKEKAECLCI